MCPVVKTPGGWAETNWEYPELIHLVSEGESKVLLTVDGSVHEIHVLQVDF